VKEAGGRGCSAAPGVRLPAEDDVLSELHRHGCSSQFEAWVRGKLAAR